MHRYGSLININPSELYVALTLFCQCWETRGGEEEDSMT